MDYRYPTAFQKVSRFSLALWLCAMLTSPFTASAQAPRTPATTVQQQAQSWMKQQQNGFTENKGQLTDQNGKANNAVKYLLNMPGLNVQLRQTGFSYDAWIQENSSVGSQKSLVSDPVTGQPTIDNRQPTQFHRVDVELEGANPDAQLISSEPAGGVTNLIGDRGTFDNIRQYRKVTYKDIYPGIDLEFVAEKGREKPVEYNFIVRPGADASLIKLKYNSDADITLKNGEISMKLAFGTLTEKIPASYTQGDRHSLAVQYQPLSRDRNLYAFNVPAYDRHKTLVIDPTPNLAWGTYVGGSPYDIVEDVSTDYLDNVYVTGITADGGTGHIATANTFQSSFNGPANIDDAYVIKFSSSGTRQWGTYIGGTGGDLGTGVRADKLGNVYTCGYTNSTSGIASSISGNGGSAPFQSVLAGGQDCFLIKLSASAGTLIWSTLYGSAGVDASHGLAVTDDGGNVYMVGQTTSTTVLGAGSTSQPSNGGVNDGFIVKFSNTGARQWGTFFGGTSTDILYSVSVDAADTIYVGGSSLTPNGAPSIASNTSEGQTHIIGTNGLIGKYDPAGTKVWARYLNAPNTNTTKVLSLYFDRATQTLVAGGTVASTSNSSDFATAGAFQSSYAGNTDGFLAKFYTNGSRVWSTYLGGALAESALNVAADTVGNIYTLTETASTEASLATNCTYQPANAGSNDALVTKFTPAGSRVWASFFGGSGSEVTTAIALDKGENIYIAGATNSTSGIATAGELTTTFTSSSDGFVAKFTQGGVPNNLQVTAQTISPLSQLACVLGLPGIITGNAVTINAPVDFTSGIFYQWQQSTSATGPWTDLTGETFKDLTPPTGSVTYYYRRLVKLNSTYCNLVTVDSSAAAVVTISSDVAPIVHADGPQWFLCPGNTITLNGSATPSGGATISSYNWYAGNSTTAAATTATYTPTVTTSSTYTLRVTDSHGCTNLDQVTVVPVSAAAGPSASYCVGNGYGAQIGTTPVASPSVAYSWSPSTNLSCANCAQPLASPGSATTYTLTVTVTQKDNTTCSTMSSVTITPVASPGANFAGNDMTICKGSTPVLGASAVSGFTYTWTPGSYLTSVNTAQTTFNAAGNAVSCPQTYTLSATSGGCTFADQVVVSVIDTDLDYGGMTLCGPAWVSGKYTSSNCTSVTYAWNVTSGPVSVVTTRRGGADGYLNNTGPVGGTSAVFTRTATLNGVTCPSTPVTINNCATSGCSLLYIKQLSAQGCPKVFGSNPLELSVGGINKSEYNFSWSPDSLVDNPTSPNVNIYSTAPATITVTVTNKYTSSISCSASLNVNNPAYSQPVFNVTDKSTCPGTGVAIGVPAVAGYTYAWAPAATLNSAAVSNPVATPAATTTYTGTVTDAATGCQTSKDVAVTVRTINFSAGPSRAVCSNGVATLGTTPGGSYTYAWSPTNGAYQNGTSATSANPQVLFGGSSNQTYSVVVTDPLTGCTLNDAVTLMSSVTAGSYAGSTPAAICPDGNVTLGTLAATGASYLWTPSTALSCTTCAQPVASPNTTTTYSLAISYPGCTVPLSDNVTVPVNALGAHNFPDVTICPSTPMAIGGTVAGATSYSWTPSSGLSCTSCASPNANPQVTTRYTATITYGNGCSDTDIVVVTPTFSASAKPDATVCVGSSVTLGLPAVPNVTYSWSPGTNLSSTMVAQPVATPTAAGSTVYTLTATGTGPNAGCAFTDAMTLRAVSPPAFTLSGNTALCAGNSTTLSSSLATAPNTLYQWTPTAGVASPSSTTTVVTPASVGTTTYKLVQTDLSSGCSNSQQISVVTVANPIVATGGTVSVCTNQGGVTLLLTTNGTYTYSWSPITLLSNPTIQNPVTYASSNTTYTATITDNTSHCTLQAQSSIVTGVNCTFAVSGSIVRDANGYTDNTVNTTGSVTTVPSGMYISLVNASNMVVATVPVATDGSYSFAGVAPGTYSAVLTNSSTGSASPVLPAGYMSTGANIGTGTGGGSNATGLLPNILVGSANVSNANIAIQQRPSVVAQNATLNNSPALNSFTTLNGGSTAPLSGSDAEDQPAYGSLTGKQVVITSLPTNGELYYNGTKITTGADNINPPSATNPFIMQGYNPSLLQFKKTGTGYSSTSFGFAYVDASGTQSTPANYSISWLTQITAQNITTPPANGPENIPALNGYDQSGDPILSYTVNTPTTGTLSYCSNGTSPCTGTMTPITATTTLTPAQAGTILFTPATGATGTPTFTYTATSDNGTSNTATVSMPIYNLLPVATSTITAPIIAGSPGAALPPLQATDADGTVTSYTITAPPAATQGTLKYCAAAPATCSPASFTTVPTSGTTTLTPAQSASLVFTPATGFTGNASFAFTALDNSTNISNTATVTIPVTTGGLAPANLPPVTQSYTAEPMTNTAGSTPIPSLIGTDPDGSIASYTITTPPASAQGTLLYCAAAPATCTPASLTTVSTTGTTTLTPAQAASLQFSPAATNAGGMATFSYTATDNGTTPLTSNTSPVSIPVQNPAPLAQNVSSKPVTPGSYNAPVSGPMATDNGSVAGYTITGVPNSATEGTLSYCSSGTIPCTGTITTITANTTLTPAQAATLVLTPVYGYTGTLSIPFTATDNNGAVSNTATLSIPVQNVSVPAANEYAASTDANSGPLGIGSALNAAPNTATAAPISTYTITNIPPAAQGALQYCSNGTSPCTGTITPVTAATSLTPAQAATLRFVPVTTYTGPANFTYTATDNAGIISNTGNVVITITNLPPVANNVTAPSTSPGGAAVTVPLGATDPDGSVSSYTINTLPPASQGSLGYCTTGTLPSCTQVPVTAGQILTPAQAATVKFTPASTSNASVVSFEYSATDNTGSMSNMATAAVPMSFPTTPLPVKLLSFEVRKQGAAGLLEWRTASEEQTARYIVQRSSDAQLWTEIGRVTAKGGTANDYILTDEQPLASVNYYRLQIMDRNGSYTLSETRQLVFDADNKITLAPNPAHDNVVISFSQPVAKGVMIHLLNSTGQVVRSYYPEAGVNTYRLSMSGLANGVYVVDIITETFKQQFKLIIQ